MSLQQGFLITIEVVTRKEENDKHEEIDQVIQSGPFEPSWDSLSHQVCPDWYPDAKFECLSTGGIYSVPALWFDGIHEICISRESLISTIGSIFGDQASFGYRDIIPLLQPIDLIRHLVDLFQKAGAQYLFPVAEHHDGFQMYASTLCLIIA